MMTAAYNERLIVQPVQVVRNPDIIVFHTGLEAQLRNMRDPHSWRECITEHFALPISIANHIIAPEDCDDSLARALAIEHTIISDLSCTTPCAFTYDDLWRTWDERMTDIAPHIWREFQVRARAMVYNEVRDACEKSGHMREFAHGICFLVMPEFPFYVFEWLKAAHYCAHFSLTSMHNISLIQSTHHSIFVGQIDADAISAGVLSAMPYH